MRNSHFCFSFRWLQANNIETKNKIHKRYYMADVEKTLLPTLENKIKKDHCSTYSFTESFIEGEDLTISDPK